MQGKFTEVDKSSCTESWWVGSGFRLWLAFRLGLGLGLELELG